MLLKGNAAMALMETTRRALDHRVAMDQVDRRLPSLVTGIVRDGKLVHFSGVGSTNGRAGGPAVTADTQYRMGSITKTFVAVEVMRLRDEGLLSLDDTYELHVPGTGIGQATIAGLLSHSAGVQAETDGTWWERAPGGGFDELGPNVTQKIRAGSAYHYSNVGYGALGELVARKRGASWDRVIQDSILDPLEMNRTTTRPSGYAAQGLAVHPYAPVLLAEPEHDAGAMAPAGQLWSTVSDLSRWAAFIAGDTAGVLKPETLEEMFAVHATNDVAGAKWSSGHGLGWQLFNIDGTLYAGHSGSMPGFVAYVLTATNTAHAGDGLVVLCNSTTGMSPGFLTDMLSTLQTHEPAMPKPWHAATVDSEVLELAGEWFWGPSAWPLVATGGTSFTLGVPKGNRTSRFDRVAPDTYVGRDLYYKGETLRVVRAADGSVSHIDLASFRFTRTPYPVDADVPGGVPDDAWQ